MKDWEVTASKDTAAKRQKPPATLCEWALAAALLEAPSALRPMPAGVPGSLRASQKDAVPEAGSAMRSGVPSETRGVLHELLLLSKYRIWGTTSFPW